MKQNQKQKIIDYLEKMPIVETACRQANVSRATFYRWRSEDAEFKKSAEKAIIDGEALITDMSESQLVSLIKDRNFHAIQLWLRHHHPRYNNRIEVTHLDNTNRELTPEQKATIEEALKLASVPADSPKNNDKDNTGVNE